LQTSHLTAAPWLFTDQTHLHAKSVKSAKPANHTHHTMDNPDLKHFPVRADKPGRRSRNYIIRAAAKRYANSHHAHEAGASSRAEFEKTLRETTPAHAERPGRPRSRRSRLAWDEDGRDLAKADVPLPSDRDRRRPSLEREDAFRDATTVKRRQLSDDAQVAELYRMGLLYDEEQPLSLNTIQRDDVYSIRRKPLRRSRLKHTPEPLALSFADLADDASSIRVIYELATATPSYDVDTSQPPELVDDMSDYDCLSEAELDDAEMPSREVFADEPPTDAWIMLGNGS
jgi:hypothetical protein